METSVLADPQLRLAVAVSIARTNANFNDAWKQRAEKLQRELTTYRRDLEILRSRGADGITARIDLLAFLPMPETRTGEMHFCPSNDATALGGFSRLIENLRMLDSAVGLPDDAEHLHARSVTRFLVSVADGSILADEQPAAFSFTPMQAALADTYVESACSYLTGLNAPSSLESLVDCMLNLIATPTDEPMGDSCAARAATIVIRLAGGLNAALTPAVLLRFGLRVTTLLDAFENANQRDDTGSESITSSGPNVVALSAASRGISRTMIATGEALARHLSQRGLGQSAESGPAGPASYSAWDEVVTVHCSSRPRLRALRASLPDALPLHDKITALLQQVVESLHVAEPSPAPVGPRRQRC